MMMNKDILVFPSDLSLEVIYVYLSYVIISLRSKEQEK